MSATLVPDSDSKFAKQDWNRTQENQCPNTSTAYSLIQNEKLSDSAEVCRRSNSCYVSMHSKKVATKDSAVQDNKGTAWVGIAPGDMCAGTPEQRQGDSKTVEGNGNLQKTKK